MTIIDREWQDGDDSAMEARAFEEGQESILNMMRLMFWDLHTALYEEMEVHDEPSLHLVESVHDWSVQLHKIGVLTREQFDDVQDIIADAGARTEME